jgi:hypothetical protein
VRRLGASLLIAFLTLPLAPASAQPGEVTLRLLRQSLYATPDETLKVRVEATNPGDAPLSDLSVGVSVFPEADSRSAYQQALEDDAPFPAIPPVAQQVDGEIEPGQARVLPLIEVDLAALAFDNDNGLFPVKVDLVSGGFLVATLRTALVFIEEEPQLPLNVNLTFVLDAPLRLQPDGSFIEGALAEEIAPQGRLAAALDGLEAAAAPVTVVISPLLLEQLDRMSRGYRVRTGTSLETVPPEDPSAERATDVLERLRAVAQRPTTEVVALPYASPSVPALVRPELGQDLRAQISRGRATVVRLLGVGASETLFRPPGALLTTPSVQQLADVGIEALLLDSGSVEPLSDVSFTPPAAGLLAAGPGRTVEAVIPEPGVSGRMGDLPDDPRLRAQVLLGELAAVYFEFPGVDRGVSIVVGGSASVEAPFLSTVVRSLTSLPDRVSWLRPASATRLLGTAGTSPDSPPPRRELIPKHGPTWTEEFLVEMAETQALLQSFAGVVGEDAPMVNRLRTLRFVSESRWLLHRQDDALRFLEAVQTAVRRELGKVQAPPPTSVTLTAQGGVIPVTIHKQADYDMRVALVLRSPRLEVIGGPVREVTLTRPEQSFTFQVRAQTTGRFPVEVLVQTPNGDPITDSRIVVRSTAYNKIALIVMIGAAVFLVAWWGRRFLPRRT